MAQLPQFDEQPIQGTEQVAQAPVFDEQPIQIPNRTLTPTPIPAPAPQFDEQPAFDEKPAEEELPFIGGENTLLSFLDLLNTPQQMLFGALTPKPGQNRWQGAVSGARENRRGIDVTERMVPVSAGESSLAGSLPRAAVATALDIFADPLLLIPVGKIAKVAGKIGETVVEHVPAIGRGVEAVKDMAASSSLVTTVSQAFSKKAFRTDSEKSVIDIIEQSRSKLGTKNANILMDAANRESLVKSVVKKTGLSPAYVAETVVALQEEKLVNQGFFNFDAMKMADDAVDLASDEYLQSNKTLLKTKSKFGQIGKPSASTAKRGGQLIAELTADREAKATAMLDAQAKALDVPTEVKPGTPIPPPDLKPTKDINRIHEAGGHAPGQTDLFDPITSFDSSRAQVRDALKGVRTQAPPALRELAMHFRNTAEDIALAEANHGLPLSELDDEYLDYALHLLTPEARRAVVDLPQFKQFGFGRSYTPAHASQLSRIMRGKSVFEINELAKQGKLIEGVKFGKFMETNPVALEAVRRMRSAKAVADFELLQDAAAKLGRPAEYAPEHWVELGVSRSEDTRLASIGEMFKGITFDPDVAGHLNKALGFSSLPEGFKSFLNNFDQVQGAWKRMTLAIFPSYHARNMIGNVWNNALAGLSNPQYYGRATELVRADVNADFQLAGKAINVGVLRTELKDMGVVGAGMSAEISQGLSAAIGRGRVASRPVKLGFAVGQAMENNARIAHYLWRREEGDGPIQAAMSVKKYLFDYEQGLTDFEKGFMRRVMPFYAWTRFNVPLQIKGLVNNPAPFVHLAELVSTARSDDHSVDEFHKSILPDFVSENSGVQVREGADGNPEYFLLGGWLPAGDLETVMRPGGPLAKAVDLLSPFIKLPIEQGVNFDLFLKRKIEEFPDEQQKLFQGTPLEFSVRRRLVHFARLFRGLTEMDRVSRLAASGELTGEEQTKLGAALRLLFNLKTYKVDVGRQLRGKMAERQDLIRRMRSAARRDDPANVAVLQDAIMPDEPETDDSGDDTEAEQ